MIASDLHLWTYNIDQYVEVTVSWYIEILWWLENGGNGVKYTLFEIACVGSKDCGSEDIPIDDEDDENEEDANWVNEDEGDWNWYWKVTVCFTALKGNTMDVSIFRSITKQDSGWTCSAVVQYTFWCYPSYQI